MIRERQDILDVDGRRDGVEYYAVNTVHIGILAAGEKITTTSNLFQSLEHRGTPFRHQRICTYNLALINTCRPSTQVSLF